MSSQLQVQALARCPYACLYWASSPKMQEHIAQCHPGKVAALIQRPKIESRCRIHEPSPPPRKKYSDDRDVIFRTWIYSQQGEKLYARDYGKRAWPIPV